MLYEVITGEGVDDAAGSKARFVILEVAGEGAGEILIVALLGFLLRVQVVEVARITSYNVCYTKLLRCQPPLLAANSPSMRWRMK